MENEQRKFRLQDKPFREIFNSLYSDVFRIIESGKEESYLQLISTTRRNSVSKVTDHFQRTLLHVAVELDNLQYARFLVEAGCHPNVKEGCGLTPLNLAVIKRNADMCRFLVSSGARYNGPLFTSIPSPHQMAQILDITQIIVIFDEDAGMSEDENEVVRSCDETYAKDSKVNKDIACQSKSTDANRSSPGFVTPVVGDVGTCKTNCAAMSRSSAFNWVGPVPGDLHNKGYFCEAIFKTHGSSGLHHMIINVLDRKKLTSEVFKERKFNEDNLTKIREAIKDVSMSYGIAAALEFKESQQFPNATELSASLRDDKTHGLLLLKCFKEWLSNNSEEDVTFKHIPS